MLKNTFINSCGIKNMEFQIKIVKTSPLTNENDYRKVALNFLKMIGYIGAKDDENSIAFKLFENFLIHPDKEWTIDELMLSLNSTKATVYRHLNKLKSIDILEESKEGKNARKTYKLRYGNIAKAWNFVEAHVKVAMNNYEETVRHLQKLVEGRYKNE